MSEEKTFSRTPSVIDSDSGFLASTFTDYIDGARLYLEAPELSTASESVKEIKSHFSVFIRQLIGSFNLEQRRNLLKKDLRRNLFYLFASWAGKYGQAFVKSSNFDANSSNNSNQNAQSDFEFSCLRAMISVLCCGNAFDEATVTEDGSLYTFMDMLLESKESKVSILMKSMFCLLIFIVISVSYQFYICKAH